MKKQVQWLLSVFVLGLLGLDALGAEQPTIAISAPTTGPAQAQPPVETTRRISITPMAPTIPALKYRLTWAFSDQVSGNAAPSYLMAGAMVNGSSQQQDKDFEKIDEMVFMPLDQMSLAEAQEILNKYLAILALIEQGSKYDRCDWGVPLRQEGFRVLLPYLNSMRTMGNLVALQAKIKLAQGDMEGAAKTLRMGYTMTRHLGQQACLIQGLVETSMHLVFNQVVMDWIQSDKGPNLYWALSNLPSPLVDVRGIMEMERAMQIFTLPVLQDVKTKPITSETWREFSSITMELASMGGSNAPMSGKGGTLDTTLFNALAGVMFYPTAKEYLKKHSYDDRRLESMTAPQILLQYMADLFEESNDEISKWIGLPCWQAIPALEDLSKRFDKEPKTIGLVVLSPPSVFSKVIGIFGNDQRQIEFMRTIEAIRAYAGNHEGKLPEKLADITATPPGIDPLTGKEFEWKIEGGKGILSKAKVAWEVRDKSQRYEITVRK